MGEKLYSVKEAAQIFNVTDRTIRNWIETGKIESYRFGLSYKIPENSIEEFMQKSLISRNENIKED